MRRGVRRAGMVAVALAAAIGTAMAVGPAANAETTDNQGWYASVQQATATGYGDASVSWYDRTTSSIPDSKSAPAYAYADIDNDHSGYSLDGWLERSTDGGASWYRISGIHTLNDGSADDDSQTDSYYDGPGYLARACFQFTSWSGAAVHCSPGI
jgi:hypothetical protein